MSQSATEKMAMEASLAEAPPSRRVTQALFSPSEYASEEAIQRVRQSLAASFRGTEGVVVRPGSGPQREGEVITFHDFSVVGLLPPFSEFFVAILEAYGLHMLHLHPNAVIMLATFAYACEAFAGVMPSVALFRHFFVPRLGKSKWIAGGVSFCLRSDAAHQYPETFTKASVGEWRHNWYFVEADGTNPHLMTPYYPAERLAHSKERSSQGEALVPVINRLAALRARGVTGAMILADFLRRGIAPLQFWSRPLWELTQVGGSLPQSRFHLTETTWALTMGTLHVPG